MIFLKMRVTLEIVTVIYIIVATFYILMESMLFRTFICMGCDVANKDICCTISQCMLYSFLCCLSQPLVLNMLLSILPEQVMCKENVFVEG